VGRLIRQVRSSGEGSLRRFEHQTGAGTFIHPPCVWLRSRTFESTAVTLADVMGRTVQLQEALTSGIGQSLGPGSMPTCRP